MFEETWLKPWLLQQIQVEPNLPKFELFSFNCHLPVWMMYLPHHFVFVVMSSSDVRICAKLHISPIYYPHSNTRRYSGRASRTYKWQRTTFSRGLILTAMLINTCDPMTKTSPDIHTLSNTSFFWADTIKPNIATTTWGRKEEKYVLLLF